MADEKDKTIAELTAKVEALEIAIEDLASQNEAILAENKELKESTNSPAAAKPQGGKPIPEKAFKVGTKTYRFAVAQFRLDGEVVKAADALKDKAMLERIVKEYTPLVEEA